MIDLILLAVILGAFYGGFKLGNKYASFKLLWTALVAKVS